MRLTEDEVQRRMKLLRMPIDFDQLIEDGILERDGAWFRLLDFERLPEHVRLQAGDLRSEDGTIAFRFPGRADPGGPSS